MIFTAKRGFSKFYKKYSGYPSGLSVQDLDTKFAKDPNFVIENAVKGMLPKNKKGRMLITNLKVYTEAIHNHEANKPVVINAKEFKI
ncbi:MAG: uL13 family ribosomal protein [Candidatus Dojkabacteria bacterium]|nr:uL13 family ribosomal protein [Candidatus Dojkabacteria bacterium]